MKNLVKSCIFALIFTFVLSTYTYAECSGCKCEVKKPVACAKCKCNCKKCVCGTNCCALKCKCGCSNCPKKVKNFPKQMKKRHFGLRTFPNGW